MNKKISASAPGKIIITGEHFVVHGSYAVAAAINKRVRVSISEMKNGESCIVSQNSRSSLKNDDGRFQAARKVAQEVLERYGKIREGGIELEISSDIPPGSGLGSSAAVSVATAGALLKFLGVDPRNEEIYEISMKGETEIHGNPSGIDIQAALLGGMVLFSKGAGAKTISLDRGLQLLVVFSGQSRKTSNLIRKVGVRKKQFPAFFECLTEAASCLSLDAVEASIRGDFLRLGTLMNVAQTSLSWIGVSNPVLDEIVELAASHDALGAKITGAGGGGSVVVLPRPESAAALLKRISKKYPMSFITSIPQEGLKWER
ncbi:MAG: mevalonate kinase [Nitrososphaerales archaeon]